MAKIFCKSQVEKKTVTELIFATEMKRNLLWRILFYQHYFFREKMTNGSFGIRNVSWCSLCKLGTKLLGYFPISRLQRIDFSCNKYLFLLSEVNAVSLIAWYKTKKESIHYSQEFIVHFQFIVCIIFSSLYSFIATVFFCRF